MSTGGAGERKSQGPRWVKVIVRMTVGVRVQVWVHVSERALGWISVRARVRLCERVDFLF